MVVNAEQNQVVQICRPAIRLPTFEMVGDQESRVLTPGKAAMPISSSQFPPLRRGRRATGTPFVHRVTRIVV